MKRVVSNIQNLGFTIMNEEEASRKSAGVEVNQTLVNERSQGVSVRLINGKVKSAAVKLDKGALMGLREALQEILEIGEA